MSDEETKKVSVTAVRWSHLALILVHTVMGALILYCAVANPKAEKIILLVVGSLLLFLSLGSLYPILIDLQIFIYGDCKDASIKCN